MEIKPHCDKGQPEMVRVYKTAYMGEDWEISCPCGFKKRYTWMHPYVAIDKWNEEMVGPYTRELGRVLVDLIRKIDGSDT